MRKDANNTSTFLVVMDMSFPPDQSVNSGIPKDTYLGERLHLTYPTVDDLAEIIHKNGQGCYLYKFD